VSEDERSNLGLVIALLLFLALWLAAPTPVGAECEPEPVTVNTPTGIAGCVVYGAGIASHWQGPGVARNDCVWPWNECQAIRITSLDTGRSIEVVPTMFCDCYTTTTGERIVDLDPAAVAELGLDPAQGLYPVFVEPVRAGTLSPRESGPRAPGSALPDTALAP